MTAERGRSPLALGAWQANSVTLALTRASTSSAVGSPLRSRCIAKPRMRDRWCSRTCSWGCSDSGDLHGKRTNRDSRRRWPKSLGVQVLAALRRNDSSRHKPGRRPAEVCAGKWQLRNLQRRGFRNRRDRRRAGPVVGHQATAIGLIHLMLLDRRSASCFNAAAGSVSDPWRPALADRHRSGAGRSPHPPSIPSPPCSVPSPHPCRSF